MKLKTIRKTLRDKVADWLGTIEDEDLREQLRKKVIVTGGSIASMLLREKVNDFDVYLRDRDSCHKLAEYYIKRFKPRTATGIPCEIYIDERELDRVRIVVRSAGIASEGGTENPYEYFEARADGDPAAGAYVAAVMDDPGDVQDAHDEAEEAALKAGDEGARYRPVFMSSNAITLSHRVQVITRFYGEPDQIHENYDFQHCTNYYTSWDDVLVLRKEALECLLSRELRYIGSRYPICSLIRLRKFLSRDWTINAGQILKMVMQVNELNLKDYRVLQDQLTGVDAAYFCELLSKLHEKDPEKINSAYLIEIVDRLF